jgi:hypothetical protein
MMTGDTSGWLTYANQNATRNQPLAPELVQAMSFLDDMGIRMDVFSGGQPPAGSRFARVGSVRHDNGMAADAFFYDATGRRLDWNNPNDVSIFQEIVRQAQANGVTGFGAGEGYMMPGSMHIGFGDPAIWGAGGRRENAAPWLVDVASGAPAQPQPQRGGQAPVMASAQPQGGQQPMQQPGLLATMSTMNQQQPRDPSIWDALVGRLPERAQGIAGRTIGDADWRDRLAIGLAGMSMRPNEALIDTLQGRMDDRSQERRINQTVQWLQSIGRTDLAEAVAAGSLMGDQAAAIALQPQEQPGPNLQVTDGGLVLDMNNGAVVADYRNTQGADPTAAIQNYQFLLSEGVPEQEARERAFGSNAPQVTTNVNTGGETAFNQETGKILAQEANTVVEQGAIAQRSLGQLATLEAALATAPQGAAGALTSFASQLGIKTDGSSAIEVAEAIISQLVPQQRTPGSGPMSDADLELFKRSLPSLINTPEGNQRIIQTMRAIAEYDVARMQIARQLQMGEITPQQAFDAYNRLGNPMADFAANLPTASAPPPATNAPAPSVISPEVQGYLDQYAPVQ